MTLTVGELVAYLDLDADPFTKGLDRAMRHGEAQGQRMSQVGGKLTRGLTLPLVAAGGAAVKLGTDFDTAFARMVGLAGVTADEVEGLKDKVLDLAGETAVAPQELAEALYFASSAGLDAAGAMDAVTSAAKASAAGMGSSQDIVGLVASAVANYGDANIDAARATDILTAAVREGRADPAELAGALGRILPFAAKLRVSFDEVAGTVAFLSNSFGDTNRAVTAAQGLFIKLQSPTEQGRKALEDMGTSAQELQAAIDQDGLLGAMNLLREKGFADSNEAMTKLFDDIEGRSAALAIMGDESGKLAGILEETADSAGDLRDAFEAAQRAEGFEMKQALVDLQVAAIQAGDVIAPFVAKVASGASSVTESFSQMSSSGQTVVVALAAVLAGAGPVLSIGGKLADVWGPNGTLGKGLSALPGKLAGASTGMKVLAGAGGALVAAGIAVELYRIAAAADRVEVEVAKAARSTTDELVSGFRNAGSSLDGFTKLADGSIGTAQRLRNALAAEGEDVAALDEILRSAARAQKQSTADTAAAVSVVEGLTGATGGAAGQVAGLTDEMFGAADGAATATDRIAGLAMAMVSAFGAQIAYERAVIGTDEALANLSGSGGRAGGSVRDFTRDIRSAAAAVEDANEAVADANEALIDAQRALADARKPASARDVESAEIDIVQARIRAERATQAVDDAEKSLKDMRDGDGTSAQIRRAELDLEDARLSARESVFSVEDAESALIDVRKKGTDQDREVLDAQSRVEDAYEGVVEAQERVVEAQERATEAAQRSTTASGDATRSQFDMRSAVLDAKDSIIREAEAFVILSGETMETAAGQGIFLTALQRVADKIAPGSPLRQDLDTFIADLKAVPGVYTATVEVENLDKLIERFGVMQGTFLAKNPHLGILYGIQPAPKPKAHAGGVVPGAINQEVDMRLLGGETVRTVDQERALQQGGTVEGDNNSKHINIEELVVQSQDSPRQWFDEGLYRVGL